MPIANLMPPELWQGIPFRHPEGVFDFLGTHEAWHRILTRNVPNVPDIRLDDLLVNLDRHNDHHQALAKGLGLTAPDDFARYDLSQRGGWSVFMQIHSLEHARLRQAQIRATVGPQVTWINTTPQGVPWVSASGQAVTWTPGT